jgi:hypothetical protein
LAEAMQTFESHRRWLAPWHFFVIPVLLVNVILAARNAVDNPTLAAGWGVLIALALFLGISLSRYMPLIAQDRMIRLEERARMARLLPADARGTEDDLTRSQYVALRFAPDEELPELVRRVRAGELKTATDIKRAIRNWRADHLRV